MSGAPLVSISSIALFLVVDGLRHGAKLEIKKGGTYRERSSPNYAYSTIKKASHNNGVQHNPPLK